MSSPSPLREIPTPTGCEGSLALLSRFFRFCSPLLAALSSSTKAQAIPCFGRNHLLRVCVLWSSLLPPRPLARPRLGKLRTQGKYSRPSAGKHQPGVGGRSFPLRHK